MKELLLEYYNRKAEETGDYNYWLAARNLEKELKNED